MAHRLVAKCIALGSLVAASLLVAFTDAASQASACDRPCLQAFLDEYLDALQRRDPSGLPVAAVFKYTENGRAIELGQGFWHTAGTRRDYRVDVLDPETGGALAMTAFDEYDGTAQVMVRLKIGDRRITEIETIVARIGDQRWFAPENLDGLSDIYAQRVPVSERHTRAELVAAADAYFTAVHTEGTPEFAQAPFGAGMKRIENGVQTTHVTENPIVDRHMLSPGEQLERAFYKGIMVVERRFPLVDIEHGIAVGIAAFRRQGTDSTTLLFSEIFKVTGGELREIRAVMINLPRGASTGW
ncbi:MAG TPA: hypothetical protein VKQ06_10530 [Gammaproteobacteria bacterium]|nr:hypothetical protein [Gammaproteobacteria bacterium]